jgi:hypothetical protein
MAGAKTAHAEVAKLTKQYGAANVAEFVTVQNFAVDDAVTVATAAGVKFPKPTLTGAAPAKRVTMLGLVRGTYYEGTMLDHLVSHAGHEQVMIDIDKNTALPPTRTTTSSPTKRTPTLRMCSARPRSSSPSTTGLSRAVLRLLSSREWQAKRCNNT